MDASITSVKNISIENTIEDWKNAIAWVKWTAEWVYNVWKSTIVWAFTLAEWMWKYALSIGWGNFFKIIWVPKEILANTIVDPDYSDKIHNQFSKISEYLEKNWISWVSEEIWKAISQELKKIWELHWEEQAQAIWNLSWNIIGMLALVKWWVALASKTASLASKWEKAWELIWKVWANTARAEKLAQISTKIERANTILKLVDIVTNWVWESLIWFALSKAISWSISLLKIWTGLTIDQLKQVKTTIEQLKEARKTAQNIDAQNLLYDSVELLENELKKVDVKVWDQVIKQENVWDITDWIEHWKSANDSKILSEKEKLHFSQFSDEIPESLSWKNTIAWTDTKWQVVYNKSYIENNFWVKITWNQWETLFDWMSLKDYMTKNPGKGEKLMNELKILKWHEVAHRLLEINGIKSINVELENWTTRIFSQEEICNVIDWSVKISVEERTLLDQFFKNKFWKDFKNKFWKDFNLDWKSVRKLDADNITKKESESFWMEREVAKEIPNIENMIVKYDFFSWIKAPRKIDMNIWWWIMIYWEGFSNMTLKKIDSKYILEFNWREEVINFWEKIKFEWNPYKNKNSEFEFMWKVVKQEKEKQASFYIKISKSWELEIESVGNWDFQAIRRWKIDDIKVVIWLSEQIQDAKSLDELIQIISKQEKIWNHEWKYMTNILERLKNWDPNVSIDNITKSNWLRDKVALLRNELIIKDKFQVLKKLWPNWLLSPTKQWSVWNCYFVSALDRIKFSSNWAELLNDLIKPVDWWYIVKFEWYDKEIFITMSDIEQMWDYNRIQTDNLWDTILERASMRVINEQKWWKPQRTYYVWDKEKFLFEGWQTFNIWKIFFWEKISIDYSSSDFKKIFKICKENDLISLSSKHSNLWDKISYSVLDINWNQIEIYNSHAYSIKKFSVEQNWCDIVNPHDSSKSFRMKISDLEESFSWLSYWIFK